MLTALRRALAMLPSSLRWGWLTVGVLAAAAAGAEAVGAGAVFLLVKVLSDPAAAVAGGGGLPLPLPRWLAVADERALLLRSTEIIALFYVLKNVFQGLVVHLQNRLTGLSIHQLSRHAFDAYLSAPFSFHLRRRTADVMHNATAGAARIAENVLAPAMAIVSELLVASGIVLVLLLASPGLTLVTLSLLAALGGALVVASRRHLLRLGTLEHAARRGALATVQQALGGLREVRVMGAEGHFRERFARRQGELARVRTSVGTFAFLPRLVIETAFILATLVVVWLAGRGGGGDLVPLLGLYAYAGFRVIPTCNRLVMHLGSLRFGTPMVAELEADLAPLAAARRREPPPRAGFVFRRELRFERVTFSYPEAERPALEGLDLTIAAGESVAIVGETGSGKSTLVDLLLGLLEPTGGRILVDGVDLAAVVTAWRSRIGYVPQSIFLLEDTLRRNVAFGEPDGGIDGDRLARAIRDAGLGRWVADLPAGLDTPLGENGVSLSGGQRQLVAIARALYRDPDVLIFDEATSSLDGATEREVSRAIGALVGARTLLMVTHRLESVRGFDRLVVLAVGRKVAEGSYEVLERECAELRRLAGAGAG